MCLFKKNIFIKPRKKKFKLLKEYKEESKYSYQFPKLKELGIKDYLIPILKNRKSSYVKEGLNLKNNNLKIIYTAKNNVKDFNFFVLKNGDILIQNFLKFENKFFRMLFGGGKYPQEIFLLSNKKNKIKFENKYGFSFSDSLLLK